MKYGKVMIFCAGAIATVALLSACGLSNAKPNKVYQAATTITVVRDSAPKYKAKVVEVLGTKKGIFGDSPDSGKQFVFPIIAIESVGKEPVTTPLMIDTSLLNDKSSMESYGRLSGSNAFPKYYPTLQGETNYYDSSAISQDSIPAGGTYRMSSWLQMRDFKKGDVIRVEFAWDSSKNAVAVDIPASEVKYPTDIQKALADAVQIPQLVTRIRQQASQAEAAASANRVHITAYALDAAFQNNAVAAADKYDGKQAEVTFVVGEINLSVSGGASLVPAGLPAGLAAFNFPSGNKADLAKIRVGEKVTVVGKIKASTVYDFTLEDCWLKTYWVN